MRWKSFCGVLLGIALVSEPGARAQEFRDLYRSARALAMGGASVAVTEDEEAVFLNPAGVAGNRKHTFHYGVADVAASWDLITSYQQGLTAFQNVTPETLSVLIGKNVYGAAQITPTLLMPNFGLAVVVDGQVAFYGKNLALPQLTMGYQVTNGIQLAYGVSLTRGFRKKGDLRLGVGGKILWRRGGYHLLPMLTLLNISTHTLSQVTGNFGQGYGLDLGAQYTYRPGSFSFGLGAAFTNIGDVSFGTQPEALRGNLSVGGFVAYSLKKTKITLAYDYRNILQDTDWRKKNHVGLEIALPFVSLYGGINQVYATYGAAFDAWLFRVTAVSYEDDLGSFVHLDPVRKYVVKVALKFDL